MMAFDDDPAGDRFQLDQCFDEIKQLRAANAQLQADRDAWHTAQIEDSAHARAYLDQLLKVDAERREVEMSLAEIRRENVKLQAECAAMRSELYLTYDLVAEAISENRQYDFAARAKAAVEHAKATLATSDAGKGWKSPEDYAALGETMTAKELNDDLAEMMHLSDCVQDFDRLRKLRALFTKTQYEVARLQRLNESLAERVAAQSELLTRKAEK